MGELYHPRFFGMEQKTFRFRLILRRQDKRMLVKWNTFNIIALVITILFLASCMPAEKLNNIIQPPATTNPSKSLSSDNRLSTKSSPISKTRQSSNMYIPTITNRNNSPKMTPDIQVAQSRQSKRIPLTGTLSREEIIEQAQKHLAQQLDISLASVILVGSETTEWNDLEMACSKPSPKYQNRTLPRSIPGLRIFLAVQGITYEYHGSNDWMFFCGIAKSGLHEKIFLPPTMTN
jgi:hypothetical protein